MPQSGFNHIINLNAKLFPITQMDFEATATILSYGFFACKGSLLKALDETENLYVYVELLCGEEMITITIKLLFFSIKNSV